MTVELKSTGEPLTHDAIAAIEESLGVNFPREYREFLATYNAAKPEANQVITQAVTTAVDSFFGITDDKGDDLVAQNLETYSGRVPDGVIAIASCAGGNLICLQMETGAIFFWDHEEEASPDEPTFDNMELLAPTLNAFLKLMVPYNPSDFPEFDPKNVISVWSAPGSDDEFKDYLIKK